jgi:hypothetical protein
MRKVLIALAAAGSALAFASPAAAQYYPAPPPPGYNQPYGGYGYNNYGQVRALHARINNVERQINRLDRRDRIGEREADRLREQANRIERRLRHATGNGLKPYEANDVARRIAFLEQRVQFAVNNGWRNYGRRFGWNNWNGYYSDRDRDGRNDRYEDDQGYRRDR